MRGMVTSRAAAPAKGDEWRMQEGSGIAFEGRDDPAADDDASDGDGCDLRAAAARALELTACASRTARVIDCTCCKFALFTSLLWARSSSTDVMRSLWHLKSSSACASDRADAPSCRTLDLCLPPSVNSTKSSPVSASATASTKPMSIADIWR